MQTTQSSSNSPAHNNFYSYPDQIKETAQQLASMTRMLVEIPNSLPTLRRVFRGEALYQNEDGSTQWVQVVKPMFIQTDKSTRKPIMITIKSSDGTEKKVYSPNDEAIEEILSMLYSMGMNQVTPLTSLSEENILDDLKEFECKLAAILALKQTTWGLDKELLPVIQTKIKTIVQDVRYMAKNGTVLKALQTTVQRVEQAWEGDRMMKKTYSPYS